MQRVDLARFRGKKNVVLYFYPRDGAPACTLQATDFSDHEAEFAHHDCVVLGVSPDDCLCHAEFCDANGVSICLLADTECEVCEKYGVLQAGDAQVRQTGNGEAPRAGEGAPGAPAGNGGRRDRTGSQALGSNGPGSKGTGGAPGRHITRATFVIDKRGVVKHALYNVIARGHALEVLGLVKALHP